MDQLDQSILYYLKSEGAFHPTSEMNPLPEMSQLIEAIHDYKNQKTASILWDLNAMLKGTAVDDMIDVFKQSKIKWALVNGGGDIASYGIEQKIMIRKPGSGDDHPLAHVVLNNMALATSANDRRRGLDGQGHIIALPGFSRDNWTSCSVLAKTAEEADVWATACFVASSEQIQTWAIRESFSVLMLDKKGQIRVYGENKNAFSYETMAK